MGQRIKLRSDTAANWASVNPILADGELAYDKTNKLLKIGDGVTAFAALIGYSYLTKPFKNAFAMAVSTAPSVAHGLGTADLNVRYFMQCIAGNAGYVVGDLAIPSANNFTINWDATNIKVSFSSATTSIIPKAGGAAVSIVTTTWNLLVIAEKN